MMRAARMKWSTGENQDLQYSPLRLVHRDRRSTDVEIDSPNTKPGNRAGNRRARLPRYHANGRAACTTGAICGDRSAQKRERQKAQNRGVSMPKKILVSTLVRKRPEPRKKPEMCFMGKDIAPRVEMLWTHGQWGRAIKAWRKKVGWSANDLARALNPPVTRSYIKKLESKRKPWMPTPRVEAQLRILMHDTPTKLPVTKTRILVSRFHIPERVFVSTPPRRCRGHNHPAFMATNQVYCGTTKRERAACEKLWRRKENLIEREETKRDKAGQGKKSNSRRIK